MEEYRREADVRKLSDELHRITTGDWTLMEVCGGQTHAIVKFGIDRMLPPQVHLLHGPGCPVCVTPVEILDQAMLLASMPEVTLCSFGDMLRVPGSSGDLSAVRARGGDVRVVYSPLDALELARRSPARQVVFLAVGFETTAPANAMAVHLAREQGVTNFTVLVSHVLVPPALVALLDSPGNRVQGFLAAGHVCTIMGWEEYRPIARRFRVPIVVTGFEPLDILQGIVMCVRQLEEGRHEVENQYTRAVRREGNLEARRILQEVFEIVPRTWRGIGPIPGSGLGLTPAYAGLDAAVRFGVAGRGGGEDPDCMSGQVLRGRLRPDACPAFGVRCTPERPLGAPMVSTEGACAAYHRYRRVPSPATGGGP